MNSLGTPLATVAITQQPQKRQSAPTLTLTLTLTLKDYAHREITPDLQRPSANRKRLSSTNLDLDP